MSSASCEAEETAEHGVHLLGDGERAALNNSRGRSGSEPNPAPQYRARSKARLTLSRGLIRQVAKSGASMPGFIVR